MKNKGFSLIELMITVGIIGILSLLAVPAYQDYAKRAMIAEGLELASGYKSTIETFFAEQGRCPASIQNQTGPNDSFFYSTEAPISGSGQYVESLTSAPVGFWGSNEAIKICGITITYRENLGLGAKWNAENNYNKPALNLYFVYGNLFTGNFGTPPNTKIVIPSRWLCAGGTIDRGFVKGRLLPKECYMNINYALSDMMGLPEFPYPPDIWN